MYLQYKCKISSQMLFVNKFHLCVAPNRCFFIFEFVNKNNKLMLNYFSVVVLIFKVIFFLNFF